MLKVKKIILPGFASTAAAIGGISGAISGCATQIEEVSSTVASELTSAQAGTGVVRLSGFSAAYQSTSGGDEFIRSGERLKAEILFNDVWWLFPDAERRTLTPANLKVTALATYSNKTGGVASREELPLAWATTAGGSQVGASDETVVPAGSPSIKIDYRVETPAGAFLLSDRLRMPAKTFPVFGAFLPNKLVFFDNDASGGARSRIVEFGTLVAGRGALLSYSDWRADRTVDKVRLDTYIGKRTTGSRFGTIIIDANGEVEYEVSVAYAIDGTWQGAVLGKKAYPAVMQTQADTRRSSYETQLTLPDTARELRLAFHVKAFLKVPTYGPGEIIDPKYGPGERILIAEKWDNADGADYRFSTR